MDIEDNGNGNGNWAAIGPDEAREAFEKYLKFVPAAVRAALRRTNERAIVDHISKGNGADVGIESLLPGLKIVNSAAILAKEYPPIPWVVPDYLPTGLTFLYGKPKVRKSWMALQLALAVTSGGKVFNRDIEKGQVLYLALEDSERRLQGRMRLQRWGPGHSIDFMLFDTFREQIGTLNNAGGKRLLAFIEAKSYRLVIVDTFSRAVQGDQLKSEEMTAAIGPIQQSALAKDISIVVIDHEPKNGDSLFGSVAKFGILDTSWRLYTSQGKRGATLDITGRDVLDHSLRLVFDKDLCFWHCEGETFEVELTERKQEIIKALEDLGRCQLDDIVIVIGRDKGNTSKRLTDLVNAGQVRRVSLDTGVYFELESGKLPL